MRDLHYPIRAARTIGTALALAALAATAFAPPAAAAANPTARVNGRTLIVEGSNSSDSITLQSDVGVRVSVTSNSTMDGGTGCIEESSNRVVCAPTVGSFGFALFQVRLDGGNDVLRISGGGSVSVRTDAQGQGGNDNIGGSVEADRLDGGSGDDRVFGAAGNDQLLGSGGRDRLDGNDGADTLNGGVNDDLLRGDENNDTLIGYLGEDTLIGGDGRDTFDGGAHADRLFSADNFDEFVDCGGGNDFAQSDLGDILNSC